MKASYEFALLTLLVAFSWGNPLNAQPPKQSVPQVDLEGDSIPKRVIPEDSGCYDQSPSCSYWALTGQCDAYPKLHTSCCVWCKHMKRLQYVKNYNCIDQHSSCYDWATRSECYKNPAYMLEFCCGSCRNIGIIVPW